MAFVNQSSKSDIWKSSSPAQMVGPGSYDVEGSHHKELMSALYPKKHAPFNGSSPKITKPIKDSPGKSTVSVIKYRSGRLLKDEVRLRAHIDPSRYVAARNLHHQRQWSLHATNLGLLKRKQEQNFALISHLKNCCTRTWLILSCEQ